MQARHRVPTVFSIYMLDVICCALGCVILLWQVAHQQAEDRSRQAKTSQTKADKARDDYEKSQRDFESLSSDTSKLYAQFKSVEEKYQTVSKTLETAGKDRDAARLLATIRLDELDKAVKARELTADELQQLKKDLEKLGSDEKKSKADLTGQLKVNADLRALVSQKELEIDKLLKVRELNNEELKKLKDDLAKLVSDEKKWKSDLTGQVKINADLRALIVQKELDLDKSRKARELNDEELRKLQDSLAKLVSDQKKSTANLTGQLKINADLQLLLAQKDTQIALLRKDLDNGVILLDMSAKKSKEQTVLLQLSEENARKLQKLLDEVKLDHKKVDAQLKLTELQLKTRQEELSRALNDLKGTQASADKLNKTATTGAKELQDAQNRVAALTTDLELMKGKWLASSKEMSFVITERDLMKAKLSANTRELTSASDTIGNLTLEKAKLNQRIISLQTDAEQRFAGVPLSGENVIFLIDVSGSMMMKDAKTEDPDKWPFLCDTLMKLMRSIPTMKRFQVILFSDKVTYLFKTNKQNRHWFDYRGPDDAKLTRDTLRKFEVGGNTNMHAGFEEAFRYRDIGLDTIYFFSDGLPNVGPGLPANIGSPSEGDLNYHLGKHVRDKLKQTWNAPQAGPEQVRINALGFYFESPDVGAFLWSLSREHRGNFVGLR